ncbi:MAG: DUF2141 domain-containing protein [Epsilonproteobacteria bacterium]|nr:MAG: DUF2141 domain-containing protein [Campylobacterota bacterium]
MKKIVLCLLVLVSAIFASSIEVNVKNIVNKKGKISIGLYDKNDENFAKRDKNFKGIDMSIDSKTLTYIFENIPDGTYAVAVFHDENQNKILDKNFFGIPKEAYGFSNNIRPMFRGANFDESKFVLKNKKKIIIKLVY